MALLGLLTIVSVALGGAAATAIVANNALVSCLRSSLSSEGSVQLPGSEGFANDTIRWNRYHQPTFSVVAAVENEHDVRASITCATSSGTPFLITGPRHGFSAGWEMLSNALEIYTGAFRHVDVDVAASTMTVGGAVVMKDVADALQPVGKIVTVGGASCVGLVGASLGAGIGRLQGLYGLMHDSMLSARLMLPNTTVVEVSNISHPELFWGLRGAGFNFGFVLNATYRVYDSPAGGTNFNADFEFPLSSVRAFYQALHDRIEAGLPAPQCVSTGLQFNHVLNATTLKVNAVYAGSEEEGRGAVQFLADIGTDLRRNFTQVPWNQLNRNVNFLGNNHAADLCSPGGVRGDTYGVAVNIIDVDAHVSMSEQFDDMMTKYPEMRNSGNGGYFCANQAVVARGQHYTAYPWRRAVGYQTFGFLYGANTTTTEADIGNIPTKLRDTIATTAGTVDGLNTYVGFSHGNEPAEAIWSEANLARLVALKKEYDPQGLFSWYHPIPLE